MNQDIIIDGDKVRCANSYKLLGYTFVVDKINYFVPLKNKLC